jgi:hypothetical protein
MRLLERIEDGFWSLREALSASRLGGVAAAVLRPIFAALVEVLRIAREMLAIPAELWLAAAELAGRVVLAAWNLIRPVLVAAIGLGAAAVRAGQRQLTPARAVALVAFGALAALAASQWVDYRGVSVGTEGYAGSTGAVAPPPDVAREPAGDAHAWAMLPLAAAGAVLLAVSLTGRRLAARLLVPLGLAVITISLAIDVPTGLDEGGAAISYQDAEARLLEGFWAQLWSGATILACGLLLPRMLRAAAEPDRGRRRGHEPSRTAPGRSPQPAPPGSSPLADPPIQGTTS